MGQLADVEREQLAMGQIQLNVLSPSHDLFDD